MQPYRLTAFAEPFRERMTARAARPRSMGRLTARIWPRADELNADSLPLGAHIMTPRRAYAHHGVYVGGGRVVQYAGFSCGLRRGPIEEIAFRDFTGPRGVWVRVPTRTSFNGSEIVRRAHSRLGENRYRLFTNNCEHFCHWCLHGEPRSYQVERRLRVARGLGAAWQVLLSWLLPPRSAGAERGRSCNQAGRQLLAE
jgi:hypothetical protein